MAYPAASDFSHLTLPSSHRSCSPSDSASDLSTDIDYSPCTRALSLPPAHPPYQHYSDLRTTNKLQPSLETHAQVHPAADCCCEMSMLDVAPAETPCDECVQECVDEECYVPLTEQCTDACVVVPCHDTHPGFSACDTTVEDAARDLMCLHPTDCGTLDDFINGRPDYRPWFPDMRSMTEPSSAFGWSPLSDAMIQGFTSQPTTSHNAFYPAGSSASTPQLIQSPSSFGSSPHSFHSPTPSTAASHFSLAHVDQRTSAGRFPCMWGDCHESFFSLNELVGHVNLQHLRLPSSGIPIEPPRMNTPSQMRSGHHALDNPLSCLWADCQLYPSPDSIPGPSSGDQAGSITAVLASHLLQDHLGLPTRPPSTGAAITPPSGTPHLEATSHPQSAIVTRDSTPTSPLIAGPLTPAPEHDCTAPHAHVCRWVDCGKSFSSCDALTTHITSAHVGSGKAHYDCYWDGCSRHGESGFASKQKICRHLQSHTGHRPFQCKVCQQNFSEAATLAQHMRRHTQEKPYVCDYPGCGKSFAITGALTIHKRTHNGHKPFKCTYCDRAFSESSNLSKHLRTHTGARPYPCTEPGCNKTFARPDQLARHTAVHRKREGTANATTVPVSA